MREKSTSSAGRVATRCVLAASVILLGQACGGGNDSNTGCAAIRALPAGQCLSPFRYRGEAFVLCNGTYSLCTTANCEAASPTAAEAQCACDVVPTGLSIRTSEASQGATSTVSNFSFAQFPLDPKVCPDGPLINCLNSPCIVSASDPSTSTCTCPIAAGEQAILESPSIDVPCSILRSGAPVGDNTQTLDDALKAAESCRESP
jgi:hypothetical protein